MSVTAAEGFVASGCHAGIKRRKFDMALLATDDRKPVPCVAVFTQNKFAAPPVEFDRKLLAGSGGQASALIVNSGNANAGTGDFSLGLNGFRVRNGAIAEPVSEMNIAGNNLEFWNKLAAVGNDPFPFSAMRTPSLVFEGVSIAGV